MQTQKNKNKYKLTLTVHTLAVNINKCNYELYENSSPM